MGSINSEWKIQPIVPSSFQTVAQFELSPIRILEDSRDILEWKIKDSFYSYNVREIMQPLIFVSCDNTSSIFPQFEKHRLTSEFYAETIDESERSFIIREASLRLLRTAIIH